MYSKVSSAALAASFASMASAALDKPVIFSNGLSTLSQGLLDNLAPTQSTWDDW